MPIFISYSHSDKDFVDELAACIARERRNVWVDRWELNVGDPLVDKIQQAITDCSALLVVLSKASLSSEWCKKERAAALTREINEKKVLALPVLLEDCEIPLFFQDKKFADFRTNFENGLKEVLEGVAAMVNGEQSRLEDSEQMVDWAEDWWFEGGLFQLRYTIIETPKNLPISVLTEIRISCNNAATRRYVAFADAGLDWVGKGIIGEVLFEVGDGRELNLVLEDQRPKPLDLTIADNHSSMRYEISVTSRKLGRDTGKDHLARASGHLRAIRSYQRSVYRKLTAQEIETMKRIMGST